jgi:hypothetical protein
MYVDRENSKYLSKFIEVAKTSPVLLVSEGDNIVREGILMSFVKYKNKIRFFVNMDTFHSTGLYIKHNVLSAAIKIKK